MNMTLQPGQGCRAAMLDVTGHIQADMRVHALPTMLLLETDSRIAARLAQTLDKYLIMEKVAIENVTADWAIVSVIGPAASSALSTVFGLDGLDALPRLGHVSLDIEGAPGFVAAQADTRLPGFDLWLPASAKLSIWTKLIEAGITPLGEQAAEALRIEAGTAVWGSELDETVLLPEAELPDAVSYTKGCYIGQEIIARLRARGHTNRALRGILLAKGASAPHPGDTVHAGEDAAEPGREIGRITSAALSSLDSGRPLALAYIRKEYLEDGTPVAVHMKDEFENETVLKGVVKKMIQEDVRASQPN